MFLKSVGCGVPYGYTLPDNVPEKALLSSAHRQHGVTAQGSLQDSMHHRAGAKEETLGLTNTSTSGSTKTAFDRMFHWLWCNIRKPRAYGQA